GEDNTLPPAQLPPIADPVAVSTLWRTQVGDGYEDAFVQLMPALSEGRVLAASHAGIVKAVAAADGRTLWQVELDMPITAAVGTGSGLALVGSQDGQVVALNPSNGRELWRTRVSSEVMARPMAADGVVVVRTVDGTFTGLDAGTGARLWGYNYTVPALTLRGSAAPLVDQGVVIAGLDSGQLLVLNLLTGTPLLEKTIAPPRGRTELERMVDIDTEPRVVGPLLLAAAYQGAVAAVDLRNGSTVWSQDISSHAGLDADPQGVVVSAADDTVWSLDIRSGDPQWQQGALARRSLTAPALYRGFAAVGDFEGWLHFLDRRSGAPRARVRVDDEGINAPPITDGQALYVLGKGGELSAFRLD
ncbi:MAG: outer membrane protein assembly factor BamB, partial [Candidatus Competibacteraceae bacterium]|nr:outer membrane protein assembly factor BamB [Candidatus Competibacteraceae bacterium]